MDTDRYAYTKTKAYKNTTSGNSYNLHTYVHAVFNFICSYRDADEYGDAYIDTNSYGNTYSYVHIQHTARNRDNS